MIQNVTSQKNNDELFFKKTVNGLFNDVVQSLNEDLLKSGFGLITEIEMDKKLNEKLNVNLKPYKILGYCNPKFAYDALQENNDIGVFLPCKVIVKQLDNSMVEVVSANPALLMNMLGNKKLSSMGDEVAAILKSVIKNLLS
ncbi:MAG: hypothetical protein A2041_15150 [Bacteroidetes bacterium GWA2_31_9b]|nr:MAG: hypothetical protein A2041_15150 [Bacteroidetes bacterium GWA2_31_9b]